MMQKYALPVCIFVFAALMGAYSLNCDYWIDLSNEFSLYNYLTLDNCTIGWGDSTGKRKNLIERIQQYAMLNDESVAVVASSGLFVITKSGEIQRVSSLKDFKNEIITRNSNSSPTMRIPYRFDDNWVWSVLLTSLTLFLLTVVIWIIRSQGKNPT